jgi:hypothetical protein
MDENFFLNMKTTLGAGSVSALERCNQMTQRYGLSLSLQQMRVLTASRAAALREAGRIEFGAGILEDLVAAFCSSPYIEQENFEDTLSELQELFYRGKGESAEQVSDDELLDLMRQLFDGSAHGSTDYLTDMLLERLQADSSDVSAYAEAYELDCTGRGEGSEPWDMRKEREDPNDWYDDIGVPGWDGESWGGGDLYEW